MKNRELLYELIQDLSARPPKKTVPVPKGMRGFGRIAFDRKKCIGCLACTIACPKEAIITEDIGTIRNLRYSYWKCVTCGLCEKSCPQEALKVDFRLDLNAIMNKKEFTPVKLKLKTCAQCGKPFWPDSALKAVVSILEKERKVPQSLIERIQQLCERCRLRSTLLEYTTFRRALVKNP